MRLNDQQQAINNVSGKNVIVSASAGTGKTTVLTDRIIGYLKKGYDISDYLVVSFTQAAAGELKERISAEIKRSLDEADEKLQRHYRAQLAKIPLADISTIHSFCLDVIKRYGFVLGIDPAKTGRLSDEGKLAKLKQKAFREALKEDDYNLLIYRFSDRPEDITDFYKNIESLSRFLDNLEDEEKWKTQVLKNYARMAENDYSAYPIDLRDFFNNKLNTLEDCSSRLIKLYRKNLKASKTLQKAEDLNNQIQIMIEASRKALLENDYQKIAGYAIELSSKYPAIGNSRFDEDDKAEAIKDKAVYDELIPSFKDYYIFNEANRENREVIGQLLKLTDAYRKNYDRLKEENEIISFEDMLKMAAKILKADNGYVARIYRNKYREILVDEYQDTNQNQENIIRSIAKEDNVFRVGDVKQSIYKFQNAKPALMKGFIDNPGDNDCVLPLRKNYRSASNIINFSNYIFNRLMNMKESVYKENDNLQIPEEKTGYAGEKIKLITVPYESDEKQVRKNVKGETSEKALRSFNAKEKTEMIAEYIASEMCHLKAENSDLKWSSFVILLRNNRYKALLKRILNKHNIPVYTVAKTGFFSDSAVSGVISLLRLILKDSRLEAMNVLSGPLFEYDYEYIAGNQQILELNNEENSSELKKLVDELKQYHKEHSLSELLDRIYNYNDFYLSRTNSFSRSNLDSLYQLVLDYEKDGNSLSDLLIYLQNYALVDRQEASGFTSKDDVVQIMTIHQSKGLQFDYVFLADLFYKNGPSKYNSMSLFNEADGMAAKYISLPYKIRHENPYYKLISHDNEMDDFAEELRILYVAITRAKNALYVVNARKDDCEKYELTYESLYDKSQTDWIKTAIKDAPDEISAMLEIKTLSEAELAEHSLSSQQLEQKQFRIERYADEENHHQQLEVLSPSSLEKRDINHLDFTKGSGSERGTLMHEAIELLGIREIAREDFEALPYKLSEEDIARIMTFYTDPFTLSFYHNRNEHEYPFISYEEGRLINGVIDLLSVGEEILVIDFKSDRNTDSEKLLSRYAIQLNNYRKIVKKKYPDKKIRALIYSFELSEYIEVEEE